MGRGWSGRFPKMFYLGADGLLTGQQIVFVKALGNPALSMQGLEIAGWVNAPEAASIVQVVGTTAPITGIQAAIRSHGKADRPKAIAALDQGSMEAVTEAPLGLRM